MSARFASERGQGTVEYIGVLLLVVVLLGAVLIAAGARLPGAELARLLAQRLVCAVRLLDCGTDALERSFGAELAATLRERTPEIRFEDGEFVSLPVDPRSCRERRCADSSERGRLDSSFEGEAPTAFVHVIDCRAEPDPDQAECGGDRSGELYLQYWLYYPDSHTRPFGRLGGYHRDDWESFQIRIGRDREADARASSHHGHQYGADKLSDVDPDAGVAGLGGQSWGPSQGYLWVSAGSHAGRADGGDHYFRSVRPNELRLIPFDAAISELAELEFGVTPPWRKQVWRDPEFEGT